MSLAEAHGAPVEGAQPSGSLVGAGLVDDQDKARFMATAEDGLRTKAAGLDEEARADEVRAAKRLVESSLMSASPDSMHLDQQWVGDEAAERQRQAQILQEEAARKSGLAEVYKTYAAQDGEQAGKVYDASHPPGNPTP